MDYLVERSGFGDVQLPAVPFARSSMRQDRDHRRLIIGRIIGSSRHGRTLRAMPMSTCQTSPRCALATGPFLRLHPLQHSETFAGDVVAKHHIAMLGFQVDPTAA